MESDWDRWWRWEGWRRQRDPIDFRRWKSCSSRALRGLPVGRDRDGVAPRLLDATCGMGLHTVIQHELGFRVTGLDRSPVALALARDTLDEAGCQASLVLGDWAGAHALVGEQDVVFCDGLHQLPEPEAMEAALLGLRRTLRPGGALVFFQADPTDPDGGPEWCRHRFDNLPDTREAWCLSDGDEHCTLTVEKERASPTLILEHHTWQWRRGETSGIERATLTDCYTWDWNRIVPLLHACGFTRVESTVHDNVHGRQFRMNLAYAGSL